LFSGNPVVQIVVPVVPAVPAIVAVPAVPAAVPVNPPPAPAAAAAAGNPVVQHLFAGAAPGVRLRRSDRIKTRVARKQHQQYVQQQLLLHPPVLPANRPLPFFAVSYILPIFSLLHQCCLYRTFYLFQTAAFGSFLSDARLIHRVFSL
jgi:hypothetical protein